MQQKIANFYDYKLRFTNLNVQSKDSYIINIVSRAQVSTNRP